MDYKCPGCGMFVADPSSHVGHGMVVAAAPTFGGQTVEQIAAKPTFDVDLSKGDLDDLKMPELKAIAEPLGIEIKPGMSKAQVRDLIRAARA